MASERRPHVLVSLKVSEFDASGALVNEITLEQRGGTGGYIETVKRLVAAIGGRVDGEHDRETGVHS